MRRSNRARQSDVQRSLPVPNRNFRGTAFEGGSPLAGPKFDHTVRPGRHKEPGSFELPPSVGAFGLTTFNFPDHGPSRKEAVFGGSETSGRDIRNLLSGQD